MERIFLKQRGTQMTGHCFCGVEEKGKGTALSWTQPEGGEACEKGGSLGKNNVQKIKHMSLTPSRGVVFEHDKN